MVFPARRLAAAFVLVVLTAQAAADPSAPADGQPPQQEYVDFARKLEVAVNAGDRTFLQDSVDWDVLAARVFRGTNPDPQKVQLYRDVLARLNILQAMIPPSGMDFVSRGVRTTGGETRALYRYSGGLTLNYFDMVLTRKTDGSVGVSDLYVYAGGYYISQALSRVAELQMATDQKKPLDGEASQAARTLERLTEMYLAIRKGEPRFALTVYDALPEQAKTHAQVKLARIEAAFNIARNGGEFRQAVEDYFRAFPDSPAVDILLLSLDYRGGRYEQAMSSLNRLERRVGPDGWLMAMRSQILIATGQYEQAKAAAERAIRIEPKLVFAHTILADACLGGKDWAELCRVLDLLELLKPGAITTSIIEGEPLFKDFATTPEYRQWKARKQAGAGAASAPTAPISSGD